MNPDELYRAIGKVIRNRRKKFKFTQERLAPMVSMSRASLANIESGRQRLLVHQLYKFAEILEISPIDLLPTSVAKPMHEKGKPETDIHMPKSGLNTKQRAQILGILQSNDEFE